MDEAVHYVGTSLSLETRVQLQSEHSLSLEHVQTIVFRYRQTKYTGTNWKSFFICVRKQNTMSISYGHMGTIWGIYVLNHLAANFPNISEPKHFRINGFDAKSLLGIVFYQSVLLVMLMSNAPRHRQENKTLDRFMLTRLFGQNKNAEVATWLCYKVELPSE